MKIGYFLASEEHGPEALVEQARCAQDGLELAERGLSLGDAAEVVLVEVEQGGSHAPSILPAASVDGRPPAAVAPRRASTPSGMARTTRHSRLTVQWLLCRRSMAPKPRSWPNACDPKTWDRSRTTRIHTDAD